MHTKKFYNIGKELFPLFRSITGKGTLKTLKTIKKTFPDLKIKKIKSGTQVFDWNIPPEWIINKAYILDKFGKKIVDIKNHNLHLVSYSKPIKKKIFKKELIKKLYSLEKIPNAIPYVTSYYNRDWGFCIKHNQKKKIIKNYKNNDKFFVNIESSFLNSGNLNYADLILPGKSKKEILISTYVCHPSMANNELSGPIVSMALINYFRKKTKNYTLRFVFLPETIGSIAYLNKNYLHLKKYVIGGFNLSCIGDEKMYSCIFSKYKNTQADKALIQAYKKLKIKFKEFSFLERGSDERQYNSPGIDLPICSVFRSKFGEYKEYHTSLDNFDLVTPKGIEGGFKIIKKTIEILQKKIIPINKILCEPRLSKKNLYPKITTKKNIKLSKLYLSFLQYSDGKNDLTEISNYLEISLKKTIYLFNKLKRNKLIY